MLLFPLTLSSSGCPTAEQWFQIIAGLVPIVVQTVGSLQTANGGLSASAEATLVSFGKTATTILDDVAADVKTAQSSTAVISKLDAELSQLQTQAQALVPQFTSNTKVLAWVNAILADVTDMVNLVPVIQGAASASAMSVSKQMTPQKFRKAKSLKGIFQERLNSLPK